jgi:cytoskeletal protein RodZ
MEKRRTDFGSLLREAREKRGLTLRKIAAATKISVSALEALERNDVKRLPGGIFTRAFVRAYAAQVGLDPEETLQTFLAQRSGDDLEESPSTDDSQRNEQFQSQQRIARTVVRLLALSVPVAGVVLFLTLRGAPEPVGNPESESAPFEEAAIEPASTFAVAEPADPVAEPELKGLVIEIHPRGACWVSLTVDGEQVFSRVMQGGERMVREAANEIVLSIGDAGAFDFTLNGRPGRPLGANGEVVTAQITRDNLDTFLTP